MMQPLAQEFIQDRIYLKGVSKKTVGWYEGCFRAFEGALSDKASMIERISAIRSRGTSTITINSYLRCINAYHRWVQKEKGISVPPIIPRLREEQKIRKILSAVEIRSILALPPTRTSMVCWLMLDTGMRISEALGLRTANVNLEMCTVDVYGKGACERRIPVTPVMRNRLYKWKSSPDGLLFPTRTGTVVSIHNFHRDMKKEGLVGNPHLYRHTFACTYLSKGGDIYTLSRILGHTSITTTQLYLRWLGMEAVVSAHRRFSPLSGS